MDLLVGNCIRDIAANETSSVRYALRAVFGDNRADLNVFLRELFFHPTAPASPKQPPLTLSTGGCGTSTPTATPTSTHCSPEEARCLLIHLHQKRFRQVFLTHARRLGLEEDVPEDAPQDIPSLEVGTSDVSKTVAQRTDKHRGLKHSATAAAAGGSAYANLESSHLFRVRFLLQNHKGEDFIHTRVYNTKLSIRLICSTLMDKNWHNTCDLLTDIPYMLLSALLRFPGNPKPREFVRNSLLTEQARQDFFVMHQLQNPDQLIAQQLELLLDEKMREKLSRSKSLRTRAAGLAASMGMTPNQPTLTPAGASNAESILKGSAEIEPSLMSLTAYMYFRCRIADLNLRADQISNLFYMLIWILGEYSYSRSATLRDSNKREREGENSLVFFDTPSPRIPSALCVMSIEAKTTARNEITADYPRYRRVLDIASELRLFMSRRAQGFELVSRGGSIQELDKQNSLRMSILQRLYASMSPIEQRLRALSIFKDIKQESAMGERKSFHWAKVMQTPWKGMVQDFSRRMLPAQANALTEFARQNRHCVMFAVDPSVRSYQITSSIKHLNIKYPSLRMSSLQAVRGGADGEIRLVSENDGELIHQDDSVPLPGHLFERRDSLMVLSDGAMCFVVFSSPHAHQRVCSYSILESLTTLNHRKLVPHYSLLIRLYAGVFGRYGQEEEARTTLRDVQSADNYENLWIVVQVLFYQLCRYSQRCEKRMVQMFSSSLMPRDHSLFWAYRWLHVICQRLDCYMERFPFFKRCGPDELRAGLKECHRALASTSDILLCFLCMLTTHTLSGRMLHRLLSALEASAASESQQPPRHHNLLLYLRHMKRVQALEPAAPQISPDEARHVRLSFYPDQIRVDGLQVESKLFEDLLDRYTDRNRLSWINILLYGFCIDKDMDLQLCGDVLFDLSYEPETLERNVYDSNKRKEGPDYQAVRTGIRVSAKRSRSHQRDLEKHCDSDQSGEDDSDNSSASEPASTATAASVSDKGKSRAKRSSTVGDSPFPSSALSSVKNTPQSSVPQSPRVFSSGINREVSLKCASTNGWRTSSNLRDQQAIDAEQNSAAAADGSFSETSRHSSVRALLLRRQSRELRVGHGYIKRARSTSAPRKKDAKRGLYYGLRELNSNPQLYMTGAEYSMFFCWPRMPKNVSAPAVTDATTAEREEGATTTAAAAAAAAAAAIHDKKEQPKRSDMFYPEPPGPIYYLTGNEMTEEQRANASRKPSIWRYETLVREQNEHTDYEGFANMLRELEWMLYHRNYDAKNASERGSKLANTADCYWRLRANEFVRSQINSRLPIEYYELKGDKQQGSSASESEHRQCGEFLCLEDSLWILRLDDSDRDSEHFTLATPTYEVAGAVRPAAAAAPHVSAGSSNASLAVPKAPSMPPPPKSLPNDSELRQLCKEHSVTFSRVLDSIHLKADSIEQLPLVQFIRSCGPDTSSSSSPSSSSFAAEELPQQKVSSSATTAATAASAAVESVMQFDDSPPSPPPDIPNNMFNRYVYKSKHPEKQIKVPDPRHAPPTPQHTLYSKRFSNYWKQTQAVPGVVLEHNSLPAGASVSAITVPATMADLLEDIPVDKDRDLETMFDGHAQYGTNLYWQNTMRDYYGKMHSERRPANPSVKEFKDRLEYEKQYKRGVGKL